MPDGQVEPDQTDQIYTQYMPKKKKKFTKKRAKKYWPLVVVGVLMFIAAVLIYQSVEPEPGISYPGAKSQWEARFKSLIGEKFEALSISQTDKAIDNNYLTTTFSDSFSSLAWVDTEETTLYFDWIGTNLLFPPHISVEEVRGDALLDMFIPTSVVSGNGTVLFRGKHRVTNQEYMIVWGISDNRWKKIDFAALGLSAKDRIIKAVYQASGADEWLIFAQKGDEVVLIRADFNTSSFRSHTLSIAVFNNKHIACGTESCVLYHAQSSEFVTLDLDSFETNTLKNLSRIVAQNNPIQVVVIKRELSQYGWVIGLSFEKQFELWQYAPVFQPQSPLLLIFSQDVEYPGYLSLLSRANDSLFVLWASYFTHAYEIQSNGSVLDLSSRFGWRILKNNPVKVYELLHALYITNTDGRIIRFNDEINTRIDNLFWFNFSPNFLDIVLSKEDAGYIIVGVPGGGTKLYQFIDYGFDLSVARQAVSKQVNFEVKNIGAARINGLDAGLSQAKIKYYLSNNGGTTWQKTEQGQVARFKDQGNDFRWKIKIVPYKKAIPYKSPYLRSINLVYWYEN